MHPAFSRFTKLPRASVKPPHPCRPGRAPAGDGEDCCRAEHGAAALKRTLNRLPGMGRAAAGRSGLTPAAIKKQAMEACFSRAEAAA